MDPEEEDVHVCLKCNSCILGLENYVTHRKSLCPNLTHITGKASASSSSQLSAKESADSNDQASFEQTKSSPSSASSTAYPNVDLSIIAQQPINLKVTAIPEFPKQEDQETYQQQTLRAHQDQQQNENHHQQVQEFSCPGCKKLFGVELTYLAHIRVCSRIEWPDAKDNEESFDDNAGATTDADSAGCNEGKVKNIRIGNMTFGQDLDFRNIQPDGRYHCILCKYKTKSVTGIRSHVKGKAHTEALHLYVEKRLSKSFTFFEKNSDNVLVCEPCGWQALHRTEMERHIRDRVHHECIMRLVVPDYSVFGKEEQSVSVSGILELDSEGASDYGIKLRESKRREVTKGDDVDRMLEECLVKKNGHFLCEVCSYSTQRSTDMDKHMERIKHNENVRLLKMELKKGGSIEKATVKKSIQWKIRTRQSKDDSLKGDNIVRPVEESYSIKGAEVSEESYDSSAKLSEEGLSKTTGEKSLADPCVVLDKAAAVASTRRSLRKTKISMKYALASEIYSDEEIEQKKQELPKRKRGRPRKYAVESEISSDEEIEQKKQELPKRKRGRPRKYAVESEISSDEEIEQKKEEPPKRKRGRPRKYAMDSEISSDEEIEQIKEEPPKRKRGRPRKTPVPQKVAVKKSKLFNWTDFTCEVCDIGFNGKVGLNCHVRDSQHKDLCKKKKQQETILECELCPSVFLSNSNYTLHMEKHELDKVFNPDIHGCEVCPYTFLSEEMLDLHTEKYCKGCGSDTDIDKVEGIENSGEKSKTCKKRIFACDLCSFHHKTKKGLLDHLDTLTHEDKVCEAAGQEKTFSCGRCGETFYTKRLLDAHLEKHTQGQQEFKICPTCGEQVLRDKYKIHCETAGHSEPIQLVTTGFKCNICDKVMSTSSSLADHKYIHTGQRPHKCPMCPFRSRRKADIGIHVKRHLGIKPFKCPQCDSCFVKKSSLTRHIATHNKNRPRNIECDICQATFFNRVILRIHKKNIHENEPPKYFCQENGCTYGCHTPTDLKCHMRSHTKERPHLCTTCGKTTATRKAMNIHQRIHTGEKPYKCPYGGCSYAARSDTHLRRHVLVHTGEKPYKCPHCDYRSNVQENLRKHIKNSRKHKGMKMYKCSRCNEWEGDSLKEMINHIRIDHGIYVKRLDVANETGILQKNSGIEAAENPATEGGREINPDEGGNESTDLDVVTIPLMQGDTQGGLDYGQSSRELGDAQGERVGVSIQPTLSTQVRGPTGPLVIKLEERVGDLLNSLMSDGLG